MRLKYRLIFPVFAFILTAFTNNSGKIPAAPLNHSKKPSQTITSGSNSNYSLLVSLIESVPVISLQMHKTVHTGQAMFNAPGNLALCLKCYNFFSGSRNNQLALSKKIFLFPFHSFW